MFLRAFNKQAETGKDKGFLKMDGPWGRVQDGGEEVLSL